MELSFLCPQLPTEGGGRGGGAGHSGKSWLYKTAGDLWQHVRDRMLRCRLERWVPSQADGCRAQQKAQWHCLCCRDHSLGRCGVLTSHSWWFLPKPFQHFNFHSGCLGSWLEASKAKAWLQTLCRPSQKPTLCKCCELPLTSSYWSRGHTNGWTLFCFELICCLNVTNVISTEIISFLQRIWVLCCCCCCFYLITVSPTHLVPAVGCCGCRN